MMRDKLTPATKGKGNDQLLYFHSTSFLKDGSGFVFIRTEGLSPNIFLFDLTTGTEKQLSHFNGGYLKSYIYYDGEPESGLGKASVTFDPENNLVYFINGRTICSVDLEGRINELAELPSGQVTAYTAVSHNGKRLCVPTTDAESLQDVASENGHFFSIDKKVREQNLNSYLRVYEAKTGQLIDCQTVPRSWITHVSFSPKNENTILYNHEWASTDMGIRRMWIWDGSRHIRLRKEEGEKHRNDFICHEVWDNNGDFIIYHGRRLNGLCFLGRVDPEGEKAVEIEFPPRYIREGHFIPGENGILVTDGFYENRRLAERIRLKIKRTLKKEKAFCGRYITLVKVDWANRKIGWFPLCRHGSDWSTQDSHPHPIFDNQGTKIHCNSNRSGKNSIYQTVVPASFYE